MNMTPEFLQMLKDRWIRAGHRPKLYQRKPGQVAEFTGWHCCVDEEGIIKEKMCPDVWRTLTNMPFSTAKEAVQAAAEGDKERLMRIVAPGVVARLYGIADKLPVLARTIYGAVHTHIDNNSALSREELYVSGLNPEDIGFSELLPRPEDDELPKPEEQMRQATLRFKSFLERFTERLGTNNPDEAALAVSLGVAKSEDSYWRIVDTFEGGFFACAESCSDHVSTPDFASMMAMERE
uniref:Putative RNA-dependent RNA polymerase n=1 Tax=Barns Ness breadcrumb sponge weivirus-like virus 2 TaxID=2021889 RepID=A0A221LFG5_9VIRU|nr:putative RNA-dependent RNA polymerase [Barns Ness breadcrumb sponge weivirus-like virus 2]